MMSRRSWALSIALVLLSALGLGACDDEPTIGIFPVELVDPAPDEPFARDPLVAPRAPVCRDCRERRVELAGGDVVTIRAASAPALVLSRDDVAFVELAEVAGAEDGASREAGGDRFAVYAVLETSGRETWRAFAAAHANRFVLVEIAGRPVDLVRPLGWTRGLRIGVFDEASRRAAYVDSLPFSSR
jgi:hypothetical protein